MARGKNKVRTKVIHKHISQELIRPDDLKVGKIAQPFDNIKVTLSDIKVMLQFDDFIMLLLVHSYLKAVIA